MPSHHRLRRIHGRQAYKVAAALPGLKKAPCLQGLVRLQDGRNTYTKLSAQHSHTRQSITVAVDTISNQLLKLIRHLIVKNAHLTSLVCQLFGSYCSIAPDAPLLHAVQILSNMTGTDSRNRILYRFKKRLSESVMTVSGGRQLTESRQKKEFHHGHRQHASICTCSNP